MLIGSFAWFSDFIRTSINPSLDGTIHFLAFNQETHKDKRDLFVFFVCFVVKNRLGIIISHRMGVWI